MKILYVCFLLVFGCATLPNPASEDGTGSAIAIYVREVDDASVIRFDAVNTGPTSIALVAAFGFDFYFNLAIESEEGVALELPEWELTRQIRGRCLEPGEKISLRVPLHRWSAVVGTNADCSEGPCSTLRLPPGTYRVRATYRPLDREGSSGTCRPVQRMVASDWFEFKVKPGK